MKEKFPIELLRPSLINIIEENNPELLDKKYLGIEELDKIRRLYFTKSLSGVEGADEPLEKIVNTLVSNDFVTDNVNTQVDDIETFSDKVAYNIANVMGSWTFIFLMFFVIIGWLFYNLSKSNKIFDPYPFALLGLFLTGLSALQAPFILNSQKKQSQRDRLKFDEDFQTNLKSELEIRNIHSKIDFYNKKMWEKLNEIEEKIGLSTK